MAHSPVKSPGARAHMVALDPLQHVSVEELAAGTGEWSNLQKVIRMTFKRIIDTSQLQGKELEMLREYSRHLGHCIGSKLDKRAVDELAERVRQNSSSILTLQAQVQSARHESQQALQDTRKELEAAMEAKGSMASLNQALDARVERTELSRFRAEVDSKLEVLSALDQRVRDVEGRVRVAEGRLSTNPVPVMEAGGGRGATHEAVVALSRRLELMQSEVCRLARNLDGKADAQEVAEALKAKVSKPSLQKRLDALAEESHETSEALRPLKAKVDAATNAAEEALRKVAAHDDAVKRIREDVDASSRAARASAPEHASATAASVKTVETLAQQTAKKVQRMEKDLVGLGGKVVAMQDDVQQRPTMVDLDNLKRMASDHNKGMQDDILKAIEARERSLNRQLEESKHAVAQLETRLQVNETSLTTRLTKVEDTLSSLPDRGADERSALRKRVAAVESRLELLTPERIETVVTTALRRAGAGTGVDELFRSIGSAAKSSSSSSSFNKLLRRLNDVDLTTADGRRLCKALQEVLRDVLGTLEQHLSLQITELAEAGDRQHEDLACRVSEYEAKFERAYHGRLKNSEAEDSTRVLRHGEYREEARPSRRRARPWESQHIRGGVDDDLEGHVGGTVTLDDALARRRKRSSKAGSGGGAEDGGVGAVTAKEWEGFREIVLRRLDFVEQEVERLEEVNLHKHDAPWVRRQEVEEAMGALQDQLTDLSNILLNLRPDNERDLTQLQSSIHAIEIRLEQTVKAASESKGALEAEVARLSQEHGQLRVALAQALQGDAKDQGFREAVRKLEEQVLECREQISTRVSALRQRFESPLEEFGERMHVITEDLREIKKKLNRPGSAWDAVGSTSSDRDAPGHALLQSRISEVEGLTRHLADRLLFVTGDVDRVKAMSPLPGSPRLSHDARPPFYSQDEHRQRSLTVEQLQEEMPRKGVSSRWQAGGGMDPEAAHSRSRSTGVAPAEANAAARHSRVSSTNSSLVGGAHVSRRDPQPFVANEVHGRLGLDHAAGSSSQRRGSWPVELPHRSRADRLSLQDGSQGVGSVTAEQQSMRQLGSTVSTARRNDDILQAFTGRTDPDAPDRTRRETDVVGRQYEAGVHDDSGRESENERGVEARGTQPLRGLFQRSDSDVQQQPEQQLDALRREKELLKSRLNLGL